MKSRSANSLPIGSVPLGRFTKSIHTLNARDNIMLEFVRKTFDLPPVRMHDEIQGMRDSLVAILSSKGISYEKLRSALVPDPARREIALVFDSKAIKSGWYGLEVFKRLIPLFDRKSNHSVLAGDYIDFSHNQSLLLSAMNDVLRLRREVDYEHSTQFFIVYISNVTKCDDGSV